MDIFQFKIWISILLVIDFLIVAGIFFYLSKIKKEMEKKVFEKASKKAFNLITPLFEEAEKTAEKFEILIKEKRKIVNQLNETLDTRISTLTFLVNRAENAINSAASSQTMFESDEIKPLHSNDVKIMELFNKGLKIEDISKELGISAGEVSMILSLKKKMQKSL
jgi:transcriptional regulator